MYASVVSVFFLPCYHVHTDFWTKEHDVLEDKDHDLLSTYALFISLCPVTGEMFGIEKMIHNIAT